MGLLMEKALGRTNALVVAISILVIAFRAGPQTSPYMPVGSERGHQERVSSAAPNPRVSSPIPERKFRILAVTPAPLTPVTTPPGGKGVKSEGETGPNENRRRIAQEA